MSATKPRKAPAHFYDVLFTNRKQIIELLEDLRDTYPVLAKSGSYTDYRLANARQAAIAKGILAVVDACDAYPHKGDIA